MSSMSNKCSIVIQHNCVKKSRCTLVLKMTLKYLFTQLSHHVAKKTRSRKSFENILYEIKLFGHNEYFLIS